jgi:hypothetical protein
MFSLEPTFARTRMDPVAAHVAHIRHLTGPRALQQFLRDSHGFRSPDAATLASEVAPFLEQALLFHDSSQNTHLRVRPVLQYYSYLNLAVAIVLVYRPSGWHDYRKHGAEDLTRNLKKISLSSPVVKVRSGAVTLFHSIVSDGGLPARRLTLRDLLLPIPMVSTELKHAFGVNSLALQVSGGTHVSRDGPNEWFKSSFSFRLINPNNPPRFDPGLARFPLKRLYKAAPTLNSDYILKQRHQHSAEFESIQRWTTNSRERADKFHDDVALRLVNFGGQDIDQNLAVNFMWRFDGKSLLLPTLTAALLLSFALASLARYRPNLLDRVETSKINLLCEVFSNEADGFIIPAFRNLLYKQSMYLLGPVVT